MTAHALGPSPAVSVISCHAGHGEEAPRPSLAADRDSLRGNAGDTIAVWSDESEGFVVTPGVVVKAVKRPMNVPLPFVVRSDAGIRIEPGGELAGYVLLHGPLHAVGTADAPVRITGGVRLACGDYTNTPCDYGSSVIHAELDGASLESTSQSATLEHVVARHSHPLELPDGSRVTDLVIEDALADGLVLGSGSVATDITIRKTKGSGLLLGPGSSATNVTIEGARVHGVVIGSHTELTHCAVRSSGGNGILVDSSSTDAVVHGCAIEANRLPGLQYEGTGSVDARFNWWGDPAGPFGPAGDGVEGNVDYSSHLTEAP